MSRSRFLRTLGALGVAAIAAAGFTGCATAPGGVLVAADSWTIMTYEAGDNNLEPDLMTDIGEQSDVGSRPGLNIVSLVDRSPDFSDDPLLGIPAWSGTKLLEIQPGGHADELFDYGDLDTGDPDVLAGFIRESIRAFPAAHYALIISDHGGGWEGLAVDDSAQGDALTLSELDQALGSGLADAGVGKLDLLAFDACLMATYEVATTMASHADRLLASQEIIPNHGFDYHALDVAARGGSVDELGAEFIKDYRAQAVALGTQNNITLSLIDLTKFSAVDDAVATFAKKMSDRVANVAPAVGRTLAQTLGFGADPDPQEDFHLKDLAIFAGDMSVAAVDVADEADDVVRAVNDVVLDKVEGQATHGATGLSIYFPSDSATFEPPYGDLGVDADWLDFLTAYYSAGAAIPQNEHPVFTSQASVAFEDGGLSIGATFDPAAEGNISDAYIQYGVQNPDGTIDYFGDEPADVTSDGSGQATGWYDLTQLTLSDSRTTAVSYLSLYADDGSGNVAVDAPVDYYAPGSSTAENATLEIGLDPATGEIVSQTYYTSDPDSGTIGPLTVEPEGTIVPLIIHGDPAANSYTWQPSTDTPLSAWLDDLQFGFEPLPSGTVLVIELWIIDFGGNSDYVSATVTIP